MGERGTVIDLKNNGKTAVVSFMRTEACAKCKACLAGFSESEMVLEARNSLGAEKGSIVIIELPDRGFFTASLIAYVFPLTAMLAGFFLGIPAARIISVQPELLSFGLGIGLLILSYLVIKLNEPRFKKLSIFLPYVSEIIHDTSS